MNPKQKIFFTQLQLASVGVLIVVFGLFWKNGWLMVFGGVIIAYGLIRLMILKNLVDEDIDQQELPEDLQLQSFRIWNWKDDEEEDDWPISSSSS